MTAIEVTTPKRGRPRDPLLEARVYEAALDVYAQSGWAGLSFVVVARIARVGKAAMYRRWSNRSELLQQALEARRQTVAEIDTGSLHDDVVQLATWIMADLLGPHHGLAAWLRADAARDANVAAAAVPYHDAIIAQCRAIVRRGIDRGEVPANIDQSLFMDIVVGGVTNHVAATPQRLKATMLGKAKAFIEKLATAAIAGAVAASRSEPRRNGRARPEMAALAPVEPATRQAG